MRGRGKDFFVPGDVVDTRVVVVRGDDRERHVFDRGGGNKSDKRRDLADLRR